MLARLVALLFFVGALGAAPRERAIVVGVTDGDTVTIRGEDGLQRKVRLSGIDAPESRQPFGQAAKRALSELVFGAQVELDLRGVDRYGRTLAFIWREGRNTNLEMVRLGFAWQFLRYDKSAELRAAEEEARAHRRGLWVDPAPIAPWEWRRGAR